MVSNYNRLAGSLRNVFLAKHINRLRLGLALSMSSINLTYANETIVEFKTRTAVYTNAVVKKIEPDGIRIYHESGFAKVKFDDLTPEQRTEFGLTEEKRDEYIKMQHELVLAKAKANNEKLQNLKQDTSKSKQQNNLNTATPRYVTSDQIKIYWYNKIPTPRTLDRNYHTIMKARKAFVEQIRAGNHDLAAEKSAAEYNKKEALKFDDTDRAKLFESEIARITQQEAEIQRQRDEQAAKLRQMQLQDEVSRLRSEIQSSNAQIESSNAQMQMEISRLRHQTFNLQFGF